MYDYRKRLNSDEFMRGDLADRQNDPDSQLSWSHLVLTKVCLG